MRTTGDLFLLVQEGNSKHSWEAKSPDGGCVFGGGGGGGSAVGGGGAEWVNGKPQQKGMCLIQLKEAKI